MDQGILSDTFGAYKLISLTKEQFAKVDPQDYDWLSKCVWRAWWSKNTQSYYAFGTGDNRLKLMHRMIIGATDPKQHGDHINHDTLDNRRTNLRVCSNAEGVRNRRPWGVLGTKGVTYISCKGGQFQYWRARINCNGKQFGLGYFPFTEDGKIEAATAYNIAAKEHFGEFAFLNDIEKMKRNATSTTPTN